MNYVNEPICWKIKAKSDGLNILYSIASLAPSAPYIPAVQLAHVYAPCTERFFVLKLLLRTLPFRTTSQGSYFEPKPQR